MAWRVLFADPTDSDDEGYGTEGLRALGRGSAAGIVGGLFYTVMLARLGSFDGIAQLIRADNAAAGVLVHAVVSVIWGAVYGLLFRRQTYGIGSAVGWGVAYGFFLWVVGPNTLFAVLTGHTPDWSAASAAPRMASMVGHLVYGAVLGVGFHYFEARHNPWWQPRRVRRLEARARRRRRQLQTSAPAIWALVMLIALSLPIIFGGSDEMGRNAMKSGEQQARRRRRRPDRRWTTCSRCAEMAGSWLSNSRLRNQCLPLLPVPTAARLACSPFRRGPPGSPHGQTSDMGQPQVHQQEYGDCF